MNPKVNVNRWRPHLQAAQRSGQSVAAYAAQHGLSRHTLYAAARALRQTREAPARPSGPSDTTRATGSAFVAVRMSTPAVPSEPEASARLMVQLPNGVVLHMQGSALLTQITALLPTLGALRCSR